jgi:hypothetical protein
VEGKSSWLHSSFGGTHFSAKLRALRRANCEKVSPGKSTQTDEFPQISPRIPWQAEVGFLPGFPEQKIMRRPLNWVVVAISLLLLVVNQSLSERSRQPVASPIDRLAAMETRFPAPIAGGGDGVEFGYVQTDGTFAPLVLSGVDTKSADRDTDTEMAWVFSPSTLISTSTSLQ